MAVAAATRTVIVLLCMAQIVCSINEYNFPKVTIQALSPKGVRIFIPDNTKLSLFAFNGKINKPISQNDVGEISAEVTSPKDGKWMYEDPHLELKVGDVINYYVFVVYDRAGYVKDKVSFTVSELESPDSQPSTSRPTECRPTVTRLRVGAACAGQTIFEDNFNSLREDLWQIEQYIPDQPEYPFVSYQRPPNAQTVTVENGFLRIEPKLQQEQDGFSQESLYTGSLNLFSGCTRTAELCSATAMGASILPPVVSGRLTSKSFAFTYGIVEVRAKLPKGDWLYPEILLESLLKKYGTPKYASGVIKIAAALGNTDLRLGPDEYGNKILYGGPIMNLACRQVLLGRKELFNGPQWSNNFHVYSVRWEPDKMTFSVDGQEWLRVEPTASGLSGRFNRFCDIPRTFLSFGNRMAPFDDHFQLALGVAVGGVTEFKDDVITGDGHPKPWSNKKRKASYNFWTDMPAWRPTWTQPALQVDYVKVIALCSLYCGSENLSINGRLRIYVSFVDNEKRSQILKSINYTVRALIAREDKGECRPTATRLLVGTACAGETLFEDKFNSLNEDLWQVEQYIPSDPEYPFMSYQRPPYAQTVTVVNGCLRIEPKLQQEQDGFSNETLYTGSLDLFNGCTRTAESCSMTAMGANILPPVVSGGITSKSFAFTYGVVEIRARLPQGDWLYPEILLEPLLKKYGTSKYASGVIKIAAALGNVDLELIPNVQGNKILYGGPLIGRKELFNESQWGDYFHVYSLRWTPDDMTFRVDGEEWLRVEPTASGLIGRFNHFCDIPRTFLSFGNKIAPFDDHFQLALGVAVGGVTEFKDGVITDFGHPKPWSNRNRKASYNFWRDLPAWRPTWT